MNKYKAAEKYGLDVGAIVNIDNLIISNRMKVGSMADAQQQLTRVIVESSHLNEDEARELAADRLASTGNSFLIIKIIVFIGIAWTIWSMFD